MKRLWSGLQTRVILAYLVIFLVNAAIIIGLAGTVYSHIALDGTSRDLEVQAYLMASALERPWISGGDEEGALAALPQLQSLTGQFAQGAAGELTVLDTRGNPLATSLRSIPANQRSAPEVVGALSGWVQHSVRFDPTTGRTMIFAAAPVQRGGHVFGIVQVAVPLSQVTDSTRQFWMNLGLTALVAAGAAALVAWLFAGQLVGPVLRLRDAAVRIATGNLDERVPPKDTGGLAEMSQLADAFNYMAERIEDMMNRQRAFVANASHELRTPLTNIKLRAEALGNGALEDPSVAQRFVGEIESEANRLSRMASDLLSLSRQDGGAPWFREPVDPAVLVNEVTNEMALRAQKGDVALVQDVQPGIAAVMADPVGLRTVLTNLVDNALQYTAAGGSVTIRALADEHNLVLQVKDTGAGIPDEDLPHVFERFYRADKSRSRHLAQRGGTATGSGAGLGLAIVRGIVEEHGGSVAAVSRIGEGTTISAVLPMEPVAQEPNRQMAGLQA